MEGRRHPDAHVAGADDEDPLAAQRPESVVDHLDGSVADRRCALSDRRFVADPFADAQGLTEEQVERRTHAAFVLADLPGVADLAEDLALPQHGGVEAGRDLEEVTSSVLLVAAVQVGVQLVDRDRSELAEEVADVGVGAVEPLGQAVDLDAFARAEHCNLAQVLARRQAEHRLWRRRRARSPVVPGPTTGHCGG